MIWTAIKGMLGGVWGYIAAGLAALAGVILVLAKAKKAGRDEVVADTATKEIEDVRKAAEVERKVTTTRTDDVRERLRDHWSRD